MLTLFIATITVVVIGVILTIVSLVTDDGKVCAIGLLLVTMCVIPLIILCNTSNVPNTEIAPYKIVTEDKTYYIDTHTITENNQLIFSHYWTLQNLKFLEPHESDKHIILSGTWKLIVRESNEVTLPLNTNSKGA